MLERVSLLKTNESWEREGEEDREVKVDDDDTAIKGLDDDDEVDVEQATPTLVDDDFNANVDEASRGRLDIESGIEAFIVCDRTSLHKRS